MYSDVNQIIKSEDKQEGQVQVTFCHKEMELDGFCLSIDNAHEAGAGYGEMAVLVRANAEGGAVADALREHSIPVVSDDSLNIKASLTVRRLVS